MIQLTKKQVMDLLGISPKTLGRRMASGRYKFTRTGEGKYDACLFTYEGIGLPEPTPVPQPVPIAAVPEPQPEPVQAPEVTVATPLGPIELKQQEGERFAQDYKRGLVTDSAGNKFDGTNELYPTKGPQTLLGPQEPKPRKIPDGTAHMNPALIGTAGKDRVENPVDSDDFRELLNPGFKERKAAMYADSGVRQPAEQDTKQRNDQAMILEAFRTGTWSR
jgi:hypothetical protein